MIGKNTTGGFLRLTKEWKLTDQAQLFKRLGELIYGGYQVQEAFHFFQMSHFLSRKEQWIEAILELKSGKSMFQILRSWRFHSDLIIFVMIAEKHGDLGEALIKGSEYLEQVNQHKKKVKKMATYPLFLLFMTTGLFFVLVVSLLPKFEMMYRQSSFQSPKILQLLYFLRNDFPIILCLLLTMILLVFLIRFLLKHKLSQTKINLFLIKIPFVNQMIKLYHSYFFSYQWSILLQKGLSYLECVDFMNQWDEKKFYQEMSTRMKQALLRGDSLATIVHQERIFLGELHYLIEHGQKNGKLEREFLSFSSICFEKLENKMMFYSSLIQPICFLCIGLIVTLLYMSMMLPVIEMLDSIG